MTGATHRGGAAPPLIRAAKGPQVAAALAGPLGLTQAAVLDKLLHPTSRDFVVLAKGVSAQASTQITAMALAGISQTASYARSYPEGSVAANIIGFTGTGSHGLTTGGPAPPHQGHTPPAAAPGP